MTEEAGLGFQWRPSPGDLTWLRFCQRQARRINAGGVKADDTYISSRHICNCMSAGNRWTTAIEKLWHEVWQLQMPRNCYEVELCLRIVSAGRFWTHVWAYLRKVARERVGDIQQWWRNSCCAALSVDERNNIVRLLWEEFERSRSNRVSYYQQNSQPQIFAALTKEPVDSASYLRNKYT